MKQLILTVLAVTIPVVVFGQNSATAEYMCNKYSGKLYNDKAPLTLKMRTSHDLFTCITKDTDSLSIYNRTNHLLSHDKSITNTIDWKVVSLDKDYNFISLEMSAQRHLSIYIPMKASDRLHFLVYDTYPDRVY